MRKNTPWKCSAEMQEAFVTLTDKFASTIHLVHPDENLPYIVNTDASAKAIGTGAPHPPTRPRRKYEYSVNCFQSILTPTQQRFTTCEQELLGIIFALVKFRIYVYGRKIILYTDNKPLAFLNRCAITSNRVARWMVNLQQYDIELRHVNGAHKHLADVISRNPAGFNATEIRNLTKPNTIMANTISLSIDKSGYKDLRNLAKLQKTEPRIQKIRGRMDQQPTVSDSRYRLVGDTLFYREAGHASEWKPILPACLEERTFQYTHRPFRGRKMHATDQAGLPP